MNNTNQNHTDNFFRQALNSPPEFKPSDQNWKEMELLLKPKEKRSGMGLIYIFSGIAAAFLVFLTLWLVPHKTETASQNPQEVELPEIMGHKEDQINSGLNAANPNNIGDGTSGNLFDKQNESSNKSNPGTLPVGSNNNKLNFKQGSVQSTNLVTKGRPANYTAQAVKELSLENPGPVQFVNIHTSLSGKFSSQRNIEHSKVSIRSEKSEANVSPDIEIAVSPGKWALSMAVSPDVNSVRGNDNGSLGMSLGMGISYRVGKALSVGTGVYYSKKIYSADKKSYKTTEKPFATWTSYSKQIDADCRVLDIPLNLTLRLSNKPENKIYVSAGMSSYLMLSEKYDFIYNNPSPAFPTGRREYTIRNENKHVLNILNLGVALERPVSDQVSLVIQPYAKLPLTGIGQGDTDLKSFGLGMKLNYSLKKKD